MFVINRENYSYDLSEKERIELGQMLMQLFAHWQIDTASKLLLLGLSPSSRALLANYGREDKGGFPNNRDTLDRVAWLLSIHQALRSLYPENLALCYAWISLPNADFKNETPLQFMKTHGLIGIAKVARYLQLQLVA